MQTNNSLNHNPAVHPSAAVTGRAPYYQLGINNAIASGHLHRDPQVYNYEIVNNIVSLDQLSALWNWREAEVEKGNINASNNQKLIKFTLDEMLENVVKYSSKFNIPKVYVFLTRYQSGSSQYIAFCSFNINLQAFSAELENIVFDPKLANNNDVINKYYSFLALKGIAYLKICFPKVKNIITTSTTSYTYNLNTSLGFTLQHNK